MTNKAKVDERTRVYETLRHEILGLTLEPGAALVEHELAARLGTSRTPVREALQQLSNEGLVHKNAGKRSYVAEISIADAVELFQIREALEAYATRLVAQSDTEFDWTQFIEALQGSTELIRAGKYDEYYRLTSAIDRAVAELTGNRRLQSELEEIWVHIYRMRRIAKTNYQRLLESVDEHIAIVSAIAEHRVHDAEEAVHQHIQKSLQHVLVALASSKSRAQFHP